MGGCSNQKHCISTRSGKSPTDSTGVRTGCLTAAVLVLTVLVLVLVWMLELLEELDAFLDVSNCTLPRSPPVLGWL